MQTKVLYAELIQIIQNHIKEAQYFKTLSLEKLNQKQDDSSWSVLECLEHLNLYGDFYLPEIEKRINKSTYAPSESFKSSWLGNYFAKSMLPDEKMKTMKTFKDKNPSGSALDKSVIDRFITQQEKMLELIQLSRKVSLSKTKTAISISKWIKLRLGDTFRFVINHNIRHIVQSKKLL